MARIVRKKGPAKLISAAHERRLKKLEQMLDEDIDFSDIPELTEKFWRNAVRNPFYRKINKRGSR